MLLNRSKMLAGRHPSLLFLILVALLFSRTTTAGFCQVSQSQESMQSLKVATHLTVEDIVVTDSAGKAVSGLPQSAFHVTDGGVSQSIRNFEESSSFKAVGNAPLPKGVFSNAKLRDQGASVDVLLIDPIGMELSDQMSLRLQALKYLQSMSDGTTMEVYRTSRDGRPLLVQSFTQDRALLIKALNNSIPTLAVAVPQNEVFYNEITELSNIADTLVPSQGRKSLIWFTGRFPLSQTLGGNGAEVADDFNATREALKSVYRKLDAARIAVFPIDVRGSMDASLAVSLQAATKPDQSNGPNMIAGGAAEVQGSWSGMDEIASATGGQAFHGNNHLAEQIRSAVDFGRHFYTLSYSVHPYAENGQWHKVHITVDGRYAIRYREGYFARSPVAIEQRLNAVFRDHESLLKDGEDASMEPIVFEAKIKARTEKPMPRLVLQYSITSGDLAFATVTNGNQQARLKVAALAYNNDGLILSHSVDDVTTHYSANQMEEARRVGVPVLQEITVAKGAKFLLLSVVDLNTGRTGTIQLTVDSAIKSAK
jgi:VWFA-related protein